MIGKTIRMERILDRSTKKLVVVPLDHGMSFGPVSGLTAMRETVDAVARGGATAVVLNKGMIQTAHRGFGKDVGLIMHLSAGTGLGGDPDGKVIVSSIEEALTFGADAVSIQINLGADSEGEMLKSAGEISRSCARWGMPLLAMVYARGPHIKNPENPDAIKRCARAAAELGADLVKTSYTGDIDTFREVVRGASIPVLIAGGPKMQTDLELLTMVRDAIDAGAAGVSIGRNIFQHKNVEGITRAVSDIVLRDAAVEEVLQYLT
ncbi:MAG TPA: 2-amino-3,7-dideoxy-D-threo-hept-6-ulosonate synthase [Methanocorpusculum sp.]|nr:2-amino-3,7-dideoxy-D-threo-hept-6-ulosonate synthase [Methanocorpusculum sp.]